MKTRIPTPRRWSPLALAAVALSLSLSAAASAEDSDGDGIQDRYDNCSEVADPTLLDADSDGYGTACDFDTNNDGAVGSDDLGDLFGALGTTDALYDFNGDGAMGNDDLGDFLQQLGTLPGPSGLSCAGTIPCSGGDPRRCDPWDPDSTLIADDADCDGLVTEEDCDDEDASQKPCLVDVSAGVDNVCGLQEDGTILCFDDDEDYPPPSGSFVQIDVGEGVSCAVGTDGAATCWGEDVEDADWSDAPEQTFASLDVGLYFACGIRTDGQLACWGDDSFMARWGLDHVPGGRFRSVAAAQKWACAVDTTGGLTCWGDTQFAMGAPKPGGTFESVSAAGRQACAVRTSGQIACWGDWSGATMRAPCATTGAWPVGGTTRKAKPPRPPEASCR